MTVVYNRKDFGILNNGDFKKLDGENFSIFFGSHDQHTGMIIPTGGVYDNEPYLHIIGGDGNLRASDEYIEVDPSKTYQMIMYAKTIQRGSANNSLAGGQLGFVCYDKNKNVIRIESLGGIGNTILSRDLNPGDSYAYVQDATAWYSGTPDSWRYIILFPATHPDFSTPYQYTRIGYGQYNIRYSQSIIQMPEGDYRIELTNTSNNPITFPNVGYPTPSGTPVSNGRAGATYNYALGAPDYPEVWTRYATPPFSGESRNSSYPFRWGTKYIRFMTLINYNQRDTLPRDHIWGMARIFFGQCVGGRDYRNVL